MSFEDIPVAHLCFFADLKLSHEESVGDQTFYFVHAGLRPGVALEDQNAEDLLWISNRDAYQGDNGSFDGRVIVRGHTYHVEVPGTAPYLINVDSGVYLNPQGDPGKGVLTCCDVVSREIWQA